MVDLKECNEILDRIAKSQEKTNMLVEEFAKEINNGYKNK